ncbi:hypothetical protein [Bacillus sp. FJAT-29814]|uniref:hypothetical protein n=1 Tax=Bacillus sp. FJAT-29814 TaxID=1729688 RepID=UPI000B31EECC|nr:hypothetical protein [Bacillus sp. FJAT-29814]
MKKIWAVLLCAIIATTTSVVFAHSGDLAQQKQQTLSSQHQKSSGAQETANPGSIPTVLVNGIVIKSELNHFKDEVLYVSVEEFASLLDKSYDFSMQEKQVTFNGKIINSIRIKSGEPTANITDLATAVGAQKITWDAANNECYVLVLPEGTIQLDPHVVPKMGEHWANPGAGDLPIGPIYGVYDGKLVFLEYMIAQEDFIQGKNHVNLAGMKGVPMPQVVQVDVEYQAHGHSGFEVPHYDIHNYFISDEEQQEIE